MSTERDWADRAADVIVTRLLGGDARLIDKPTVANFIRRHAASEGLKDIAVEAELRERIAELERMNEDWKAFTAALRDHIGDLERERSALLDDKARLDWLASNHEEFAEELHRIGWRSPCDAQWDQLKLFLRRIRAAVDAARKEGA